MVAVIRIGISRATRLPAFGHAWSKVLVVVAVLACGLVLATGLGTHADDALGSRTVTELDLEQPFTTHQSFLAPAPFGSVLRAPLDTAATGTDPARPGTAAPTRRRTSTGPRATDPNGGGATTTAPTDAGPTSPDPTTGRGNGNGDGNGNGNSKGNAVGHVLHPQPLDPGPTPSVGPVGPVTSTVTGVTTATVDVAVRGPG